MEWAQLIGKGSGAVFSVMAILVGAIVGYLFGSAKLFRAQKHKAYEELLPPIVRMAYNPAASDEAELNRALMILWLYGSKIVVKKMNFALSCTLKPARGDATKALQEAVSAMRADVQFNPLQRVDPRDIEHLYTRIVQGAGPAPGAGCPTALLWVRRKRKSDPGSGGVLRGGAYRETSYGRFRKARTLDHAVSVVTLWSLVSAGDLPTAELWGTWRKKIS